MDPVPIALILISATALYALFLLMEKRSGKRFLGRFRTFLDRVVEALLRMVRSHAPAMNRYFFRQIFHYVVHRVLTRLLRLLEWVETSIRAFSRLNRKKAVDTTTRSTESHLAKIVEHKSESALSPKEKAARRAAALRGDL